VQIEAWSTDPASGLTFREIQALALQQHVSQRDASLLGLKRLPGLPKEYYRVLDWEPGLSFQEFLARPTDAERTAAF
jgi:hypothetical protein